MGGRSRSWQSVLCLSVVVDTAGALLYVIMHQDDFSFGGVSTGINNNNNNRREEEEEWDVLVVLTQDGRSLRPTKWM